MPHLSSILGTAAVLLVTASAASAQGVGVMEGSPLDHSRDPKWIVCTPLMISLPERLILIQRREDGRCEMFGDRLRVVSKECLPALRRRRPTPHHVFGDRRLGNLKPQHQQFAMARFHQSFRRCGGLAARRPRAAAGDAGGRLSQRCIFRHFRTPCAGRTCEALLTSAEALRERCSA